MIQGNSDSDLPNSWEVVKLGVFVESEKGKKPKSESESQTPTHSIPYIDIQAFEESVVRSWTDGVGCRICYESDFLMVWDGSRSGLVGKGMNGALGSTLMRINFPSMVNQYAFYFLQSKYQQINTRAKGSGTPHVDPDLLWNYDFPIPPLNEQRRIVAKLEELFSGLDKGIENLKTARAQLKVYRQAVLKHAFEGKLTAKWREENKDKLETPEQLLTRIQQEREARYQQQLEEWKAAVEAWEKNGRDGKRPGKPKTPKPLPLLSDEELAELPNLPYGWYWIKLSAISETIQIGPFGSLLHKADYVSGGVPLVNPSHIKVQKVEPDWDLTVSPSKLEDLDKYVMRKNDIVVGRRGEMGRCAVITKRENGWLCGTGSLFVRLPCSINAPFYSLVLGSQRVKEYLGNSSIGTTMRNLNENILHGVPVPLCSKSEQDQIISEIERQYSVIDQLQEIINTELTQTDLVRQSILKKAFSGQLVPQDPNDEPASRLLERIRAEKATQAAKQNPVKRAGKKRVTA